MAGVKGMAWGVKTKGMTSFRFTFHVLAFLKSLKCGERTAFIEQLIEASSQYQSWQEKRG